MHYRNGRVASEGDKVVCLTPGNLIAGILHSTGSQSDTCNGRVAPMSSSDPWVNIKDCLHIDDVIGPPEAVMAPPDQKA